VNEYREGAIYALVVLPLALALAFVPRSAGSQNATPAPLAAPARPTTPVPLPYAPLPWPGADDPPLNTVDTLTRGIVLNKAQCNALETAVWVTVEGRTYCVRYWLSAAGGQGDAALVYIHADVGGRDRERVYLADNAEWRTAGLQQRQAERWSRIFGGPFISIGRIGAYGSSGDHLRERRLLVEVRAMMAALDVLKMRYGFQRFHVVGQSGGGHTVAALLEMRSDLGCAVMTSGILSVKTHAGDLDLPINAKIAASYDPIDFIDAVRPRPAQRIIVMSDPADRRVPFHSQREFVEHLQAKGVPVLHIMAAADDDESHELVSAGLHLAADCAKDVNDATLVRRYQTMVPRGDAPSKGNVEH
jgi:Prolyl oligopeptidase family